MKDDLISRQVAIDAMAELQGRASTKAELKGISKAWKRIKQLPSAQPDLPEAYARAVWAWLLDYQIKVAELDGKYSPYEVLSWVANDWRKEHDYSQF